VLAGDLGYSDDQIADLMGEGAIVLGPDTPPLTD
jgi:hypothetical protein